eukprot:TRINITY_DN266_c0_g1_i3.p1 TRINITY_DN266_c0_g1~~TRINITY_DN266_c0_g1_i3.p1  ORF type:complete len:299 (+),score=67.66 TRINITY_DN266_c0_g1_i3:215-1111(+)
MLTGTKALVSTILLFVLCIALVGQHLSHAHTAAAAGIKKKQARAYTKQAIRGEVTSTDDDDDDDVQYGGGRGGGQYPVSRKGRLHKDLFKFNWDHIAPNLHDITSGDIEAWNVTEMAEQIYMFPFLTKEYCTKLIEELEHADSWKFHGGEEEQHPYLETVVDDHEPEITTDLEQIPGLDAVYYQQAKEVLKPVIKELWPVFDIQKYDDPYAIKYDMSKGGVKRMNLHYDAETVTLIVYLNDDYHGGGTYFPRWNFTTNPGGAPPPAGTAVLYPGGVSHIHGALPLKKGKRYLLLAAFY